MDDASDPLRLIGRQRIHGVDEDRLDPRVARLRPAVVEGRVQEALGLAGTRPGGDHGGSSRR